MVQRHSEPTQIQMSQTSQRAQSGVGGASARQAGGVFSTQVANQPQTVVGQITPGAGSQLVQNILGKVSKSVDSIIDSQRERAYLDGAAAIGAGIQEEQLETNILTRSWKIAGHRDYSARIEAAKYESELIKELGKDREMNPEEYAKKVVSKRQKLMPSIEGMSAKSRHDMFNQLLTMERSAIAKQAGEHGKFIVGVKMQAITAEVGVSIDSVNSVKGNPDAHSAAADALFTKIYGIHQAEDLGTEDKSKIITDATLYALQTGDFSLYTNLYQQGIQGDDGEIRSIASSLTFEDQTKLAKAFESAKNLYDGQVNANFHMAQLEDEIALQAGELPSADYIDRNIRASEAGIISASTAKSNILKATKLSSELQETQAGRDAYLKNDVSTLYSLTNNPKLIGEAIFQDNAKHGIPLPDNLRHQINVGLQTGNEFAFEVASAPMQAAVAAAMNSDGELDQGVYDVLTMMRHELESPTPNVSAALKYQGYMRTLKPEQQLFMASALSKVKNFGFPLDKALLATQKDFADRSAGKGQNPQEDARFKATFDKVSEKLSDPKSWLSGAWMDALSSPATKAMNALRLKDGFFATSPAVTQAWQDQLISAGHDILNELQVGGVSIPSDAIEGIIAARLQSRMFETEHGRVLMPENFSVESEYDIPVGYNSSELLKRALAENYTPKNKKAQTLITFDNGGFRVHEYSDASTTYAEPTFIEKEDVKEYIQSSVKNEQHQANVVHGEGEDYSINGGHVKVNGVNTAGIKPELALHIRKSLADFEAVRYESYPDGKNNAVSIGVGMNSGNAQFKNAFPNGLPKNYKMSQAEVDKFYNLTTNEFFNNVMYNTNKAMAKGGNQDAYIEMLTHLQYQWGNPRFVNSGEAQAMQKAIGMGDLKTAHKHLKKLPPYMQAGPDRKKYYDKLLNQLY